MSSAGTDATLRVLGATAAVMMAISSAVADGVSLRGVRTNHELGRLKQQLTATGLQNVCLLLMQVQDLAGRDVARALQTMKQIIDALEAAVHEVTRRGGNATKTIPKTLQAKTFRDTGVPPRVHDDMLRLKQRLIHLETALMRRRGSSMAGRALQRVRVTIGRSAVLAAPVQPITLPASRKGPL